MRIRRIAFLILPAVLIPLVFVFDVANTVVNISPPTTTPLRELSVLVSFIMIGYFVEYHRKPLAGNVMGEMGRILFGAFLSIIIVGICTMIRPAIPAEQPSMNVRPTALLILITTIITVTLGILSLLILFIVRDLTLFKRRSATRRFFYAYVFVLSAATIIEIPFLSIDSGLLRISLFVIILITILINSFRQNWIVYLSKREKVSCIIYSFLISTIFLLLYIYLADRSGNSLFVFTYSRPLYTFIRLNLMLGTVYFGMAFFSTLFHLPTAEIFERKQSELKSLHNLGRLVTQVLDFNDLVNTVTQMTTEVCNARSVWLELYSENEETGEISVEVVSKKNIMQDKIDLIDKADIIQLRGSTRDPQRISLIEDIWNDRRTRHLKDLDFERGSLLSVPLLSHEKIIGVLHAIKDRNDPFDQDDIDVMKAFADQASVAIENSRLISRSIERERLHQEMMVARRMQKRLLPQNLPDIPEAEFSAETESSFEVGGDYYDVIMLPEGKIALVISDVAGKGVSAAFYMAELKGIILSLIKSYTSPKELLLKANESLRESLEKSVFISAIFGMLDPANGKLTLARAGHCPALFVSGAATELIKSNGLGLGLTDCDVFGKAIEERTIELQRGDICIFYTDGITEARNSAMEEYGYERLFRVAEENRRCPANELKDRLLADVRTFMGDRAYTDDVTLLVVKWLGKDR